MNRKMRPALYLLSCLAACCVVLQSHAATPLADRLERPAALSSDIKKTLFTDIQAVADKQLIIGASGRILLRSNDGAVAQAKVPADILLTAAYFIDGKQGWAVGHDGLVLHTTDGGNTWTKQIDGNTINKLMVAAAEAQVERAQQASDAAPDDEDLISALDNAIFALDDATAGSEPGPSRPLLDVWFRNANEGWAVGAYGIIIETQDGGKTWSYNETLKDPDRLHLNTVTGLADGSLLVAGEGGLIYRSADGGQHWQDTQSITPASLYSFLPLQTPGHILAFGFGGTLLRSEDAGLSWQSISLPIKASLYGGAQLADGSIAIVGQGGSVLYSKDTEHFNLWNSSSKSALLGVSEVSPGQLLLIGSNGLHELSLATLKEQLQ